MSRPDFPTGDIERFDRMERAVHWLTTVSMLVLLATGSMLYIGPLSGLVKRTILKDVHVVAGLFLPVPIVLAMIARKWNHALRADLRRLGHWSRGDGRWMRSLGRRRYPKPGKFNAGQKLFAAVVAGVIPVMLATGSIMRWPKNFKLDLRTGATFVHDWLYLLMMVLVVGHALKAMVAPGGWNTMLRGRVNARDANEAWPGWIEELDAATPGEVTEVREPEPSL